MDLWLLGTTQLFAKGKPYIFVVFFEILSFHFESSAFPYNLIYCKYLLNGSIKLKPLGQSLSRHKRNV